MQNSSDDDTTFTCTAEADFVEFNKFDYIILFNALDPIRKTSKEFLLNQISAADAYKRIRNQYEFYACTMKKNLSNNRKSKKTMETLFGALVYMVSVIYTVWVVLQLFRIARGRKQSSISLIYALISLLIFNPAFSVLTIVFDILSYRSTFRVDSDKKQLIEDVEKAIEEALKCRNPEEFTKQKVCAYYRYFEQSDDNPDSKLLCECGNGESCESNSELKVDKLANKMVKMDNINQFFENQKRFVLKEHNPYTAVKQSDSIDRVVAFCMGRDTVKTIRYHMSNNTLADKLITENATTIRNNASKLLQDIESFNYKEIGAVESYDQYFVVELNALLFDLTKNVLLYLSYDNNRHTYVRGNPKVNAATFTGENYPRLVFRCNNHSTEDGDYTETSVPVAVAPTKQVILELMLNVQTRLKRLNKLWLPEYEALHRFLYKGAVVDHTVQRALYRANTIEDIRSLFYDIVAMVLNNDKLHASAVVYVPQTSMNAMTHCHTSQDSAGEYLQKNHVYPVPINITAFYGDNFAAQETMMMSKMESFLRTLSAHKLGKNFASTYKVETTIVQNIVNNEIGDMLVDHPTKVKEYVLYDVNEKQRYFGADENRAFLFISNVNAILNHVAVKRMQSTKNSELFFNAKNEVERPHLYVVYPEFELKLDNIDQHEFDKYAALVDSVNNDMEYITDHTELLNSNLERQHYMANIYSNFIIIYFFMSLLILFDISFKTVFNMSLDEYIASRMFDKTLETPLEKQSDKAKAENNEPSMLSNKNNTLETPLEKQGNTAKADVTAENKEPSMFNNLKNMAKERINSTDIGKLVNNAKGFADMVKRNPNVFKTLAKTAINMKRKSIGT